MPIPTDPAPCDPDEQLYECLNCGARLCSAGSPTVCPECDAGLTNISRPRPE